jgi:hypothetical protein
MPEQLESLIPEPGQQSQDSEIPNLTEEITGTLQQAFDILVERRDAAFAAAIAPLDVEIENLTKEYSAIGEAAQNLAELLPAKARVAQAEHDRLLLAGDREGAAEKLWEQKEAESARGAMSKRQSEIAAHLDVIDNQKRSLAKNVFQQWYAECQAVIRAAEHGLFITLLDGLKQSFFDFEQQTDTFAKTVGDPGLFTAGNLTGLTSDERSPEWISGSKWYRGRSR